MTVRAWPADVAAIFADYDARIAARSAARVTVHRAPAPETPGARKARIASSRHPFKLMPCEDVSFRLMLRPEGVTTAALGRSGAAQQNFLAMRRKLKACGHASARDPDTGVYRFVDQAAVLAAMGQHAPSARRPEPIISAAEGRRRYGCGGGAQVRARPGCA